MIRPALTEIGIFLIPFAVYALFLLATRSGLLVQSSWPVHVVARLVLGSLLLVIVSFVLLAHFSGAPPNSTYVPAAYRERQARSRSRKMSGARVLDDAPWLTSGPAARVLALLNARWRGGARGRRRGPQRAAGHSDRRYRYRDHGVAGGSDPPRQGGRHQERADRHRAWHRDAGRRRAALRGHDAARGYRDLRPQGQGRVRPRLGRATPSGATSPSTALSVDADGVVHDHVGGLDGYRRAARALHRRARPAHRRGLSAHPALLPHSCGLSARASPIAPDISPASRARAGLRPCRPSACAWRC